MSAGIAFFDFDGTLVSSNRRVSGQRNAALPALRGFRKVPGFQIRKQ
jgi:hydroxymethylpyrimidine pyrophosphatase-like HAD family hydrolase